MATTDPCEITDVLMTMMECNHPVVSEQIRPDFISRVTRMLNDYQCDVEADEDNRTDELYDYLTTYGNDMCRYRDGEHFSVTAVEISDSLGNKFCFEKAFSGESKSEWMFCGNRSVTDAPELTPSDKYHNEKDVTTMNLEELGKEKKELAKRISMAKKNRSILVRKQKKLKDRYGGGDYMSYSDEEHETFEHRCKQIHEIEASVRGMRRRKEKIHNLIRKLKNKN